MNNKYNVTMGTGLATRTTSSTQIQDSSLATSAILNVIDYEKAVHEITPEQREHCAALTKDINTDNPHSIQSYGLEINRTISKQSDALLSRTSSSRNTDIIQMTNQLLKEIGAIEHPAIEDDESSFVKFLRQIPFISSLIKSHEDAEIKKKNVLENVGEITKKIESLKVISMSDNTTIENMLSEECVSLKQLQDHILALMVVQEELEREIEMMENAEYCDLNVLTQKRNSLNTIRTKLSDLVMSENVFKQNIYGNMALMTNNDKIINKSEYLINITVPLWKQQLAMNILIENQNASIEIEKTMSEAANNMLLKNMQSLHKNSIEVAKVAEESVFRGETLKETTKILIDTIKQVQDIRRTGEQKSKDILNDMRILGEELNDAIRNG